MPSRSIPPQQQQSPPLITPSPSQSHHNHHHHHSNVVPPIAGAVTAAFSLFLLLTICFRKITRKRTVPADSKPPHRYSYSVLRRATDSFSPSNRLGQGGFGSVFRGTLPATSPNNNNQRKQIAVKVMDSGSLQGEREFQNEIFLASKVESDSIVSVLGFSSDRKRRRMLLVYELMSNGNLQDALLHKKAPELMEWKERFSVALDIAKGLDYLHGLNPPVIHGDIKPSNILLDQYFTAKIADLGLARLKEENNQDQCEITVVETDNNNGGGGGGGGGGGAVEEYGSVVEETESVTESNLGVDQSPESFIRASSTAGSLELSSEVDNGKTSGKGMKSGSVKEWWWKQENGGEVVVKDYVMEWIGTEIKKERPKSDWIEASSSSAAAAASASNNGISSSSSKLDKKKKKHKKRLDWWVSFDDDKEKKNSKSFKKEKRRPAREWWKEEYCEELAKENKKKKKIKNKEQMGISGDEDWLPRDEDMYVERKKKNRSRGSRGSSIDWWLDGLSGELFRGRRNSHDSGGSGGGCSSTPSMRGTVCYVAPEYGGVGGGDLSEKCDVYSFGVLLLVLIAGRRPLQVTGSPMSEFQRANLLSWARHLARNGKLIDLVDKAVQSLDREQALLCITIALLCLQKLPARRPSMKEIVAMLTGESQPPQLPTEFSPSPPSRLPYKSHKKAR